MVYGKLLMEKPGGEEQKKIPLGFSWLMLFFGPLVPLFRGQTLHFFLSVALFIPTMSVSWWTYPFFINFFWRRKYFSKGYNPVEIEGTSYDDVLRRTGIDIFEEPSFKRDSDRVFGRWLLFLAIQAVPILILGTYLYQDHQSLMALRDENPTEYLERIKGRDNYWDELRTRDPERYAAEWPAEQKRREEAAKKQAEADLARYIDSDRQRYWDLRKETELETVAEIMKARRDEFFHKVVRDIEDQPRYPSQENMENWLTARNIVSSQDGADMYRLVASMSFNLECEGRDLYVGLSDDLQDAMTSRAERLRGRVISTYGRYPNFSGGLQYLNNTAFSAGAYIAKNDAFNGDPCLYYDRPLVEYYSEWLLPDE